MSIRNISVVLSANTSALQAGLARGATQIRTFSAAASRSFDEVERSQTRLGKRAAVAGVAIGAGIGLGFAAATKAAISFEKEMRNVNTIMRDASGARLTEAAFRGVGQQVLALSQQVPQSADTLARGLYDIVSSGFQGAEAMTVLRSSAVAATAGLTDTATAARGITSVLNAYGMSGANAASVSNTLFQTVNLGVLTFEQLSNVMGDFVGSTAAAGVSIEDANSALATMTLAGINASEASTSLNRVMQSFVKPSEAMKAVMASLNIELSDLAEQGGLLRVMQTLQREGFGGIETLVELFPEIRAARGALALMANESQNFSRVQAGMTNVNEMATAAMDAFKEQSKSASFQIGQARNAINAAAIGTSQAFVPAVRSGAEAVGTFAAGVSALPGPLKGAATALVLLAGATALGAGAWRLFGSAAFTASKQALLAAGVSATAFRTMTVAMGGVGIVLGVLTYLWGRHNKAKQDAAALATQYADVLDRETGAITANTIAFVVNRLVTDGVTDAAERLGISAEDVAGALLGEEAALRRVNAALDRYGGATKVGNRGLTPDADRALKDVEKVEGALGRESKALQRGRQELLTKNALNKKLAVSQKDVASSTDEVTAKTKELEAILGPAGEQVSALDRAMQGLSGSQQETARSMSDAFGSFSSVLSEAVAEQNSLNRGGSGGGGRSALQRANDMEQAQVGVLRAQMRLVDSTRELNRVRTESMAPALAGAERDLAAAQDGTIRASLALRDAERALAEARDPRREVRTQQEAEIAIGRARIANAESVRSLADAQERLSYAREGGDLREVAAGEAALQEAMFRQRETVWQMQDAQEALTRLREDGGRVAVEAEIGLRDAQRAVADSQQSAVDSAFALMVARENATSNRALIEAELDLREAMLGVAQAAATVQESLKDTSGSDSQASSFTVADMSLRQYVASLNKRSDQVADWQKNMTTIVQRGGGSIVKHLTNMGMDGARIVEELARATPQEFDRMRRDMERFAIAGSAAVNAAFVKNLGEGKDNARRLTMETATAIADELGIGIVDAIALLKMYGYELEQAATAPAGKWAPAIGYGDTLPTNPESPANFINPNARSEAAARIWKGKVRAKGAVDAGIYTREVVKFAEPETGGELYVPRRGISRDRAAMLLDEGASWYGMHVMAKGGVLPKPPTFDAFGAALGVPARHTAQAMYDKALAAQMAMATVSPSQGGRPLGSGAGWQAMMEALRQVFPGLRLISGLRPGAITATGRPSYHGMGRAVDLPPRRDVFDWIAANYGAPTRELIFSPAGGRQIHNGRPHVYGEPTRSMHFDHVHWAMAKGGILNPWVRDGGGPLMPGFTFNGTGGMEQVIPRGSPAGPTYNAPLVSVSVQVSAEVGADAGHLAREIRQQVEPVVAGAMRSLSVELDQS